MHLRAYVHRRLGRTDGTVDKRGDVVIIHLSDAPLPAENSTVRKRYRIVEPWQETGWEAILAELLARRNAGEVRPVKPYPYAAVSGTGLKRTIVARSLVKVDLDALERGDATADKALPVVDYRAITTSRRTKPAGSKTEEEVRAEVKR